VPYLYTYEIPQGYGEIQATFQLEFITTCLSGDKIGFDESRSVRIILFGPWAFDRRPFRVGCRRGYQACHAARALESQNAPECTLLQTSVWAIRVHRWN